MPKSRDIQAGAKPIARLIQKDVVSLKGHFLLKIESI